MKFRFLLCCFLALPFLMQGQIVNTEKLRTDNKDKKFVGDANVDFSMTRNKAGRSIGLGANVRLEYHPGEKHRLMFFGGSRLTQFRNVHEPIDSLRSTRNFVNNRFAQIRYNYDIKPFLTWEAFSQAQSDEIQEVQIRLLNGTGPRFRIIENDSVKLFVGALYMYEYEETTDLEPLIVYNRNHRLSTYVSAGYKLTPWISISHITYFQPRLDKFADFRISSETDLTIDIKSWIALSFRYQLVYDTRPPETVPELMYSMRNGLKLRF